MNMTKVLFLMILILSTSITLSSNNWLGMWMGLEINLMAFIPLISKNKNKKSSQGMMIYFMTQSIGSITMLFSMLMNPLMFMEYPMSMNEVMTILMMISIMIKIGAAPFHFWLPEMMSNLNWLENMLLMTWQKMAPLTILSQICPNNWFLYSSVMLSTMIGAVGGLNQTSLRKIMAYSSINHLSWMMMFMSMNNSWYKYFIIYSILVIMICLMMNSKNVYFINQLMTSSPSLMEKFTITFLFLSMGGLPPFLGFLPKWMVIQMMINSGLMLLMLIMLLFSLLTLFYYMRFMISYFMSYSMINKWMKYKSVNNIMMYLFSLINLILPIIVSLNLF
uniref:NADH-ubiquinone oxidoreductase chain 2 n=1 Tax=Sinodasynus sp. TaxID=2931305 RepID=A0A8T9ZXN1_9HEMI|nr:NADH dehydrogenase subunit 2 [Sinodasynus sp.]